LELHHVKHHATGGDNSVENLITLCNVCHDVTHKKGAAWSKLICKQFSLFRHWHLLPNVNSHHFYLLAILLPKVLSTHLFF
jgi:5-methylcytosine-specific restriction endonuclease McrA